MTLLLTTPEQHSFQDPTLELNAHKLRRWLAGLPVLSAAESLRAVLDALEPLNEQQLEPDRRLALLSVYQTTFKRLFETAEPLRLRQQPLSRRQRLDTVNDVERLGLAMANGFKLLVKDYYALGDSRDNAVFAQVLRWTLRQLAAALLHSYRFYRPEPALAFLELNEVYRLARHLGLHDTPGQQAQEEGRNGMTAIYQAICLLSLCDPFSLEEGVVDSYYRCLLQYAGKGRVIPGNSWQGIPEGLYYIDLRSDTRPRHCVFLDSPVDGDDPYIFDARSILQQMHKALLALSADRRRQRPEAGILKALLPEVTPRDKRASARHRDGRWIELVAGLQAITGWLSAFQKGALREAGQWQVKDASERGYCLVWDESSASLLQVGDLVCVVSDTAEEKPQRLQLMVVRWLRDVRSQGAELGVELIDGTPSAIQFKCSNESDEDCLPGVFMSPGANQGMAARVIAPAEVYAENRSLLIYVGEREVPIQCGELIERTPAFDCFEFTGS